MSQLLPSHEFEWLSKDSIENLDVSQMLDNGEDGYIFEVDLEYPNKLHDRHNDYPLAPATVTIRPNMMSPYQKNLAENLERKITGCEKLVPNLDDKNNYVVHYRNLKLYLDLGMKLHKVHRVLKFKQSTWLKPYIDFNTEKRKVARNEFEKDFYKLMNNSVFV